MGQTKPVFLCVPVLNRYDLLGKLMASLALSTVQPAMIYVIDNGNQSERLTESLCITRIPTAIYTPIKPLGLAAAWNWFITNVEEERLIVNDDITFAPESIERLVTTPGDLVSGLLPTNAFSCFVLRDSCVEKVGMFDEWISPGYAYFEDCDYEQRMRNEGIDLIGIDCGVYHQGSQTVRAFTGKDVSEHHRRFLIAQTNYLAKWGRLPHGMQVQK